MQCIMGKQLTQHGGIQEHKCDREKAAATSEASSEYYNVSYVINKCL